MNDDRNEFQRRQGATFGKAIMSKSTGAQVGVSILPKGKKLPSPCHSHNQAFPNNNIPEAKFYGNRLRLCSICGWWCKW